MGTELATPLDQLRGALMVHRHVCMGGCGLLLSDFIHLDPN